MTSSTHETHVNSYQHSYLSPCLYPSILLGYASIYCLTSYTHGGHIFRTCCCCFCCGCGCCFQFATQMRHPYVFAQCSKVSLGLGRMAVLQGVKRIMDAAVAGEQPPLRLRYTCEICEMKIMSRIMEHSQQCFSPEFTGLGNSGKCWCDFHPPSCYIIKLHNHSSHRLHIHHLATTC